MNQGNLALACVGWVAIQYQFFEGSDHVVTLSCCPRHYDAAVLACGDFLAGNLTVNPRETVPLEALIPLRQREAWTVARVRFLLERPPPALQKPKGK